MIAILRLVAWLVSGVAALVLLTIPIGASTQLAFGIAVILAMTAIWCFGRGRLARWVFVALGSFVALRYMDWRLTSTLPPIEQPVNFALGVLLVAAELYCIVILTISLVINADPLERDDLPRGEDADLPSVDIFIPSYNEDASILATTIAAAKSLDYPAGKLAVWLLDDGGTDQKCADTNAVKATVARERRAALQELCAALGARYVTRARNEHAKAGNLNNGLRHSKAEIVVVFDADHAPFRSFLRETIGHFALDPKLFLVQTPHVFLNPDPIERNLRTFDRMPSENEMFYAVTQRGLDKWNGSFFCGSAALLRRTALDEVGGFSGMTITEDCETAFELHSRGWTSVYVDKPLIAGLQPETFESFIGQRSRWCQGMFQLFLLKNPLFKKGLRPIQRLAYLSSMTFWFFPLPRMVFTIAPLLHIFFDVKIFVSSMDEAIAYTATYMVVNLMLQNYLYGHVRWPFVSELYEYVQGVYLSRSIVSVMLSPRSPSFNVTAKGISLDEDHLSNLSWPFFAIFGILAVGAVTAFVRYWLEPGADLMLIVGLWTSFNLVIAGAALGVVAERREPDRHPRLTVRRAGVLTMDGRGIGPGKGPGGGRRVPVTIESVSAGGCAMRWDASAMLAADTMGMRYTLSVPSASGAAIEPLIVEQVHSTTIADHTISGFTFVDMTPARHITLADLMYGDPEAMVRFLSRRKRHKNLAPGIVQFMRWGLGEPVRAFTYAARSAVQALVTTDPRPIAAPVSPVLPRIVATPSVASVGDASFDALVTLFSTDAKEATPIMAFDRDAAVQPTEWMHMVLSMAAAEMRRASASDADQVPAASAVA